MSNQFESEAKTSAKEQITKLQDSFGQSGNNGTINACAIQDAQRDEDGINSDCNAEGQYIQQK